jgi:CubicO group peptidase (beta-lactamase class C family)
MLSACPLVALILLLVHSAQAGPTIQGDRGRAMDQYVSRQEAYGFSGAVLVAENENILLCKGYGLADRKRDASIDERTRFNLASLTKPFTATLILRLEQDGVLIRIDKIAKYLPNVPEDKKAITIEQLLTHTSGLPWDAVPRGKNLSRDDALGRILAAKLRSRPGERYAYSNAGYELLALIAETATGRSYGELLRAYIFAPAELKDSGVVADEKTGANVARGYDEWRDLGTWRDWNDGWRHGSGDVVSTLADTYRWFCALRDGKLIAKDSLRDMFKTQAVTEGESYGYGWFTSRTSNGDSLIAHGGDNRGYHTELRWYVDRDLVMVVFTNLELYDESGSGLGLHKRIIANALSRIARGESVDMPPEPRAAAAHDLARYAGVTNMGLGGGTFTIALDGDRLTVNADGQAAINSLLGPDAERMAAANRKSETLLQAVATRDTALVRETLGEDAGFFLTYAFAERDEMEARLGAFTGAELSGTKPLPWDDVLLRTFARLRFARGTVDYQYTWKGDSYYESISETGQPHAVMLPLAPVGKDEFVAWDIVARRGARLRFAWVDGGAHLESVEPLTASDSPK